MISITNYPKTIQPVVSDLTFELYDPSLASVSSLHYRIDVRAGDTSTALLLAPHPTTKRATIDVSDILQDFFQSQVFTHDTLSYDCSSNLVSFYCKCYSLTDTSTYTTNSNTFYVFNGVDQYNSTWDVSSWTFTSTIDTSAYFLSEWTDQRYIHFDDDLYFQFLSGTFGTIDSSFNGLKVTKHQWGGTSATETINIVFSSTPSIKSINVGPTSLNSNMTMKIDTNTLYYTIENKNGRGKQYKINIKPTHKTFTPVRFYYVNSLGAVDSINADLINVNSIEIDKNIYINQKNQRVYGTKVTDKYTALTNWLPDSVSKGIKDLWYSNRVYATLNGVLTEIIITDKSKDIKDINEGLIQYTINFIPSKEFNTLKN